MNTDRRVAAAFLELVECRSKSVSPKVWSGIAEQLVWLVKDEGGITELMRAWLAGDDEYLAGIALGVTEWCVFATESDARIALDGLRNRCGGLTAACDEFMERFRVVWRAS